MDNNKKSNRQNKNFNYKYHRNNKRKNDKNRNEDNSLTALSAENNAFLEDENNTEEMFTEENSVSEAAEPVLTEEKWNVSSVMESEEPITESKSDVQNSNTEKVEIVGIRFRNSSKVYYFSPDGIQFKAGDHAIVETVRGVEFGSVSLANKMVHSDRIVPPLKSVIRKATKEDYERDEQNHILEANARPIWDDAVKRHSLSMQLVDVEYTFDNAKLVFYFTAEGRVDFRELVKELASVFRTRIELRQIGVRDEAKMIGGLGVCGRPFCCKVFLPDFNQVSIKMAKDQNLSLSSSKISGTCGRLMCCLKFESDVYEQEYATFPKVDSIVSIGKDTGVIIESNFLTGKVKVRMDDPSGVIKTFLPKEVKVIGKVKEDDSAIDKSLLELEDK